ncbi:hypothetical protein KPZU09_64880 [Klebsiella pneumoniae]|uniref:Uncharacterized protein n=1 Tax=Klebsiella pneumoniae TaxID=573 RepID=A0A919HZM0_KLEPN|nr:hypothetical protein KPZU09_64880 [Klebsiella pneumoniae]
MAVRPRLTGEVPTVPSETVLFADGAAVARQLNAYPCAGEAEAVLVKIALALSAVVPER